VIVDIYDMQQSKYWLVQISEDLLVTQQILTQAKGYMPWTPFTMLNSSLFNEGRELIRKVIN